ncbi:LysR family transcriptional regulator [Luteolibacter ambystomatis]|uniref:LysR family transcriptional regulator n=1 Tax=Luteolibacter ambystomatis TaxID=2824561 RepID=A0A975PGV0_9BACT|nr:LysR substrate-binding domain-containing protein [Luteolibacter ambystomatis]QUE52677.1 LysR family transcriptional regulator [Luteolibacter ambystomatis]
MELRHLRYFVTVAEELNFRRAAERLNVTRPALSKQIKDLEEELGVTLLDRNTVRVTLTDAGNTYLVDARAILAHVDRAKVLAREVQAGRRGHLLIASVGPIAAGFMPEALKSFGDEFPDVDVGFVEMMPPDQLDALTKGQIHIGFAYGKKAALPRGFKSLRILQTKFAVALYHGHALAERKSLTLGDITRETLLCLGRESESKHCKDVRTFFNAEGVTHGPTRYIQGFDSLLTMIAADHGVALLPRILDLNRIHGIVLRPLIATKADLDFSMWAVWKDDVASPLVHEFIRRLKDRLPVPFKSPAAGMEGAA